jgi:hypothetical protein
MVTTDGHAHEKLMQAVDALPSRTSVAFSGSAGRNLSMRGSNQYVMRINLRRMERSAFVGLHLRQRIKSGDPDSKAAIPTTGKAPPHKGWSGRMKRGSK